MRKLNTRVKKSRIFGEKIQNDEETNIFIMDFVGCCSGFVW